jgi:CRISPR-associated protein Cas1
MQLFNTLYVNTQDSYLRLDNDTLRVLMGDETRLRVPLHHLQAVVCFGRVGISLPLMHRLAEEGKALVLLDENGRFKARLEGPTSGNVLLRRAQHMQSMDTAFALGFARACVAGKVRNARQVLLRGARDSRSESDAAGLTRGAQDLAATLRALPDAGDLDVLRGLEGEAARQYFDRQPLLVKADLRSVFSMDGRTRRPPRDRMNALLSFLYSMWMNDCRSALETVGLDPQVGFLHVLRPGRAALALDLMEEFRPFADRLALSLVNRHQVREGDFAVSAGGGVSLSAEARKAVVIAFQERKQEEVQHPVLKQALPLGLAPLVQARLMARAIRQEADEAGLVTGYLPFLIR